MIRDLNEEKCVVLTTLNSLCADILSRAVLGGPYVSMTTDKSILKILQK